MHLCNEKHDVTITVDPMFTLDSVDNNIDYDYVYNPHGYRKHDFSSTFCILNHTKGTDSAIALIGSHYCYDTACAVLNDNILTILQDTFITKIDLDTNTFVSTKEIPDSLINYSLYKTINGLVICGELEIIGLDDDCNVIWRTGSRDVMTDFKILEDRIQYSDCSGNDYEIGMDGRTIG